MGGMASSGKPSEKDLWKGSQYYNPNYEGMVRPNPDVTPEQTSALRGLDIPLYSDPRYLSPGDRTSDDAIARRQAAWERRSATVERDNRFLQRDESPQQAPLPIPDDDDYEALRAYYLSLLLPSGSGGGGPPAGPTGLGGFGLGDFGGGDTSGLA